MRLMTEDKMSHYSVCFKLSQLNSSFACLFSTLLIWKQGSCLSFHCHNFNPENSAWHRIRTPYILSEQMHFEWINEVIPNIKIPTTGEKITQGKLVGETCRKVTERRARANILLSALFPHCSCFWVCTLLHLKLLNGGLQPISIQFQLILWVPTCSWPLTPIAFFVDLRVHIRPRPSSLQRLPHWCPQLYKPIL